jgi:hypothetical protein
VCLSGGPCVGVCPMLRNDADTAQKHNPAAASSLVDEADVVLFQEVAVLEVGPGVERDWGRRGG